MSEYNINLDGTSNSNGNEVKKGSFTLGIVLGVVSAVILALVWAGLSVWIERQFAWGAIIIGGIIGGIVSRSAPFDSIKHGIVAALCSIVAVVLGDMLIGPFSNYNLYFECDLMSFLFYGFSAYVGFKVGRNNSEKDE